MQYQQEKKCLPYGWCRLEVAVKEEVGISDLHDSITIGNRNAYIPVGFYFVPGPSKFTPWRREASLLGFSLHLLNTKWMKTTTIKNQELKRLWREIEKVFYLRLWNQTLICLGSMLERIWQSRMSCWRRIEVGFGHSW